MLMQKFKNLIHLCFNAIGLDLVKAGHFDAGLASHLKAILKSRDIDCVLDVGANIGQYGQLLREIGYTGHIVSFEPVKTVFDKLLNKAENDQKWICYNLALSDESHSKDINVYGGTQFSSFLDINDYAKNIWDDVNVAKKETVKMIRLDDLSGEIESRTGCRNVYLKLDTQGFDLNVFRGALNSLGKVRAMQSELALISVYENMQDPYAVLQEYHDHGFFISGLYPINKDASMAVIEYDCVLVKRDV